MYVHNGDAKYAHSYSRNHAAGYKPDEVACISQVNVFQIFHAASKNKILCVHVFKFFFADFCYFLPNSIAGRLSLFFSRNFVRIVHSGEGVYIF